ncbi:MAG: DUF2634 domain-containing protein [Clostridia bacterium]|nr:DUF2634 domain-containing protein [Clostridia bacterium]
MSDIFPQNDINVDQDIVKVNKSVSYGRSPIFDFEAGEFKTVDRKVYIGEGVQVLKNWIEKTIRTERFRFPIYSFDYGITLEELVVRDFPYEVLVNEIKEQIAEALMQDIRIDGIGNFEFERNGSYLNIGFEVTTFDRKIIGMEVSI